MNSVKTKQMKYTAEAKLIMPVNKCKIIEKFTDDIWCKNKLVNNSNNDLNSFCNNSFNQSHCPDTCNPSAPTAAPTDGPQCIPYTNLGSDEKSKFCSQYSNACPVTCNNPISQQTNNGLTLDPEDCKSEATVNTCFFAYDTQKKCPNTCATFQNNRLPSTSMNNSYEQRRLATIQQDQSYFK